MLTALRAITYIPVHVVPFPMKSSTQSQVKLPTESLQTAFTSQLSRPSMHSLMSAAQKKIHCVVSYYSVVLMSVVIMHWYTHSGLVCYVMYVHVSMHVSCSLLPKLSQNVNMLHACKTSMFTFRSMGAWERGYVSCTMRGLF